MSTLTSKSALDRWSVPIRECGEPLRPLSDLSELVEVKPATSARAEYLSGRGLWARFRVVEMLARMARNVAPAHHLVVVDAYRSLEYQRQRFDELLEATRLRHPAATEDELHRRVDVLVAIPQTDPRRPPPHSTGGAIDMMLMSAKTGEIDYGSRISHFEDPEENARHATDAPGLGPHHREARARLVAAAMNVGFANHPGEWWHFMFGDQEHALAMDTGIAVYGRADLLAGPHTG